MADIERIENIKRRLAPIRAELLRHEVYAEIDSIPKLRLFMQHHVFAVWDFMCLLKTLQRELCHNSVPWLPPADGVTARLVNEIVLGEESDEDGEGGFASHFELYRRAMRRCGTDTNVLDQFIRSIRDGSDIDLALATPGVPVCVRNFVRRTFDVIETGDICAIASDLTFGREDLLPDIFQCVVDELDLEAEGGLEDFRFYLGRHIELDGDLHGPMSARMMATLCGEDDAKWQSAEEAAVAALHARKKLWDGMCQALRNVGKSSIAAS